MSINDSLVRNSVRIRPPSASRLITVSGLGLLFDSMDVGLLGFVLVALAKQWHLQPGISGLLGSLGFVGMAVGSALAGQLADRFGRKNIFMWTLLIYSIATGLTAFAWGVGSFLVLRFLVGFGLGGELPVATTYVLESSPDAVRGRRVVLLEMFYAFGSLAAALISCLIIPALGWRIVFLIGALPALYVLVLRSTLPESPQFSILPQRATMGESFRTLWSKGIARSSAVTWFLWFVMNFVFYGMALWLPSMLAMRGYSLVNSLGYVLIMDLAQIPGYLTAAWLVEKWGRKRTLVPAMALTALAALGFGYAPSTLWLIVFGLLLNYFIMAAWPGTYVFTVEQFPIQARASGMGWAAGVGRTGSILAPLVVGWMLTHALGFTQVFVLFFIVMVVGFLIVWGAGRETKRQVIQ